MKATHKVTVRLNDYEYSLLNDIKDFLKWLMKTDKITTSLVIKQAIMEYYNSVTSMKSWKTFNELRVKGDDKEHKE